VSNPVPSNPVLSNPVPSSPVRKGGDQDGGLYKSQKQSDPGNYCPSLAVDLNTIGGKYSPINWRFHHALVARRSLNSVKA
jgi:hypothetical protein